MRFCLAAFLVLAFGLTSKAQQVLSFDSLTNLLSKPNPRAFSQNGKAKLRVEGYWNPGDWGAARDGRWVTNSQATNVGSFFAFPGGTNGFLIFDDCYNDDGVRMEWFGALPDATLSTAVHSRFQSAIDFVTSRTNAAGRKYGGTVTSARGGVFPIADSITLRSRLALRFANSSYSDINFVTTTVTNTSYLAGSSVQFVLLGGTDKPPFILDPTDPELYIRQKDEPQEDGSIVDSKQYSILLEGFAVYIAAQNRYDCHAFKFANAWGIQLRDVYVWSRYGYAVWAKDCNALKLQNVHLVGGYYGDGGRGVLMWGTGDSKIVDSEIGGMIGPGIWITGSSAGKDTLVGNQVFNQQRHRQVIVNYDTGTDTLTLSTNHLLETGMLAEWTREPGSSPSTNIAIHRPYWVIKVSGTALKLAATEADALAGTAIDLSGAIAGTNYIWSGPGASLYGSWAAENMVVSANRFEQNQETGIYLSDSPGWSVVGNMTYYNQYDNVAGTKDPISVPNIYLRGNNVGTVVLGNSLDADSVRYGPDYGVQVEPSSAAFVSSRVILGPNGVRNSVIQDYLIGTNNFHVILTRYSTNESTGYSGMFISRLEAIGSKLGNTNSGADVTIPLELQTPSSGVPVITARRLAFPKLGLRVTGTGMGAGNQNGWLFMNEEEAYFMASLAGSTNVTTMRLGGTGPFQLYTRDAEIAGDIGGVADLPSRRILFNPPTGTGAGSVADSGHLFRLPISGASGTVAHTYYDAARIHTGGNYIRDALTIGTNQASNPSAILDLVSTTRGFLPPRMTTAQRTAISGVNGLIVYDTDLGRHYGFQGGVWTALYADGGGAGGGAGTNLILNGALIQPARITNSPAATWGTNANGDIVIQSVTAGSTNSILNVNSSPVTSPNLVNTSDHNITVAGSDISITLSNTTVTPGTYTNVASLNVDAKGRVTSVTSGPAPGGGSGAGTNLVLNGALIQPARITNSPAATWGTNANGDIVLQSVAGTVEYQSGPVAGRAGSFGEYIRTIYADATVSMPVQPRLLLLAPIGGQSLATGSGGVTNSFSTTPRHPGYSLSWTQGVHYGEPGTGGVVIASSALTAVKDLFAEVVTGPGRSETPVVAAVDYWNTYWSNNLAGSRARVLAVTHGLGGAELNAIDEGTASFSNLVAHIQGAANVATASNWVLNVPVWYFVHGENDTYLNTPVENYRTNFLAMYDRMNSTAKAASGQTNDPIVIMTQTASRTYENQSNSWPANAQLLLNQSDARIKVAVPTYVFPVVADGVHLTNIVSAWLGEYLSKAARRELFGEGWNPVMPTNIVISGTNVVLKYHVPNPPLVFDTTRVSNPGNYGFGLDGATIGTPLVSGSTVTIPFTAGTPTRVKYGWNGTIGADDGPTTGQRGNLRDSDTEVGSLTSSNLYNWGLIFNLPTTVPATPAALLATGGNGKITLSWSRADDTAYYVLKRSVATGGPYATIKVTNGVSYEDTDVAPGVIYYYVIQGHGPSGDSLQSAEVTGTTSGGSSVTRLWVPTDLGSKLVAWWRASSVTAGDGNPIDTWVDESGNSYNLSASGSVRPTQQTVGGRKVVRFDGTDDRMDQTALGARFGSIGEANFWTVGHPNATNVTAGSRNFWYLSRTNAASVRLSLAQSANTVGRYRYGGSRVDADSTDLDDSNGTLDTNATSIVHAKFDFTNSDKLLYTNGVLDHSDTSFASAGSTASETLALYRIGASGLLSGGSPTNWLNGDIEMQIISVGALTTDEKEKVEGYIAHAIGITNLLAISHPYKTNAPTITIGGSGGTSVFVQSVSVSNPDFVASADITNEVSGSTVTANLIPTGVSAGSYTNPTVQVDVKGRITSIANGTAGGGSTNYYTTNNFTVITNNLGFLSRSAVEISVSNTVAESEIVNFVLPGNTLGVDGDEIELFVPSRYIDYTGSSASYDWTFYVDYDETPFSINGVNCAVGNAVAEYAQVWTARIKRLSTNTYAYYVRHELSKANQATNTVDQWVYGGTTTLAKDWGQSFNFALTVTLGSASTSHRVNTFGYTVHKVGAASAGGDVLGPVSSAAGDLAIMFDSSGKVLRAGGPFTVAQSNLVAVSSVTNFVADLGLAPMQFLVATNDVNVIHATNAAAGRGSTLLIQASGANRTVSLPANLKRTKTSIVVTNGSVLPINFYAYGAANSNVVATVGAEGF